MKLPLPKETRLGLAGTKPGGVTDVQLTQHYRRCQRNRPSVPPAQDVNPVRHTTSSAVAARFYKLSD